ncbi:hypothetical protein Tco_1359523 [Tanacetum coccineum]
MRVECDIVSITPESPTRSRKDGISPRLLSLEAHHKLNQESQSSLEQKRGKVECSPDRIVKQDARQQMRSHLRRSEHLDSQHAHCTPYKKSNSRSNHEERLQCKNLISQPSSSKLAMSRMSLSNSDFDLPVARGLFQSQCLRAVANSILM